MSATAAAKSNVIDFIQPDKAKDVGGELENSTKALVRRFGVIAVVDQSSCQQAVLDRQAIGDAVKNVETFFAPFKSMAHKLHKALCDRESEILAPVRMLDNRLRLAIGDYKTAEDRARQVRERELAEQARKEAQDRAAQEAAQLESAGEHAMAAAVIEEAIAAPAAIVVLADTTKEIEGLSFVTRWHWKFAGGPSDVTQTPPALVARTMELIPREFLCLDEKKVGAYARNMKATGKIPGLDIYSTQDPIR